MSENQTVISELKTKETGDKKRGNLKIQADMVKKSEDIIKFQISAQIKSMKTLCFGNDDPFLLIERGKIDRPGEWMKVFKTDYVSGNLTPSWDTYQLTMTDFCNNNKSLPLRLSVKSYRNSGECPTYGESITSTREIEMAHLH